MNILIYKWHSYLDMPKHSFDWHKQDIEDELNELKEATGIINKWSELSDVAYTFTRAKWSGHNDFKLPISKSKYFIGLLYMFPKYTLRWKFFQTIGKRLDKNVKVREVRNPKKNEKLKIMAQKYNFNEEAFLNEVKNLKKKWFFLK